MNWHRFAGAAVLIVVCGTIAALVISSGKATAPTRHIDPAKASALVEEALSTGGFNAEEVLCPGPPAEKGRTFHCQFLVGGEIGSADLQVITTLGFTRVTHLHGLESLEAVRFEEQEREEQAEEEWREEAAAGASQGRKTEESDLRQFEQESREGEEETKRSVELSRSG